MTTEPDPQTRICLQYPKWNGIIYSLIAISSVSLLFAYIAPLISVNQLWVFKDTVTMFSSIITLFTTGNYLLGLIVALFAVVFPIIKMFSLFYLWHYATIATVKQHLNWLSAISKWAMLDVFVIAMTVVIVKLGALMQVTLHFGLVFFITSILLSKMAVRLMHRIIYN